MRTNRDPLSDAIRQLTGGCLHPGGPALTRRALEAAAFAPGARLLDLGCGGGVSLGLLAELGFAAVGLDRCRACFAPGASFAPGSSGLPGTQAAPSTAAASASSRVPASSGLPKAAVLLADMTALPFADAVFDGILCECVLSLAKDKAKVLAGCARLLCPGGRLILSDLTLAGPQPGETRLRQFKTRVSAATATAEATATAAVREAGATLAAQSAAPPVCAGGALSVEGWRALIEAAGLRPVLLEDQSRALKELAAGLVLQGQSLAALSGLWHNAGMAADAAACGVSAPGAAPVAACRAALSADAPAAVRQAASFAERPASVRESAPLGVAPAAACGASPRLGYFLLIAEKRGEKS